MPVCIPELGEDSDRYVRGLSRGVFCGGGGGDLEAALSSRARAAAAAEAATAAAEEAERRRAQEEQPPPVSAFSAPPPPPPAPPPPHRHKSDKKDKNVDFWKPGRPWLCARWQPAGAVEAAAAAAAAAAPRAGPVVLSSSARPSDFALPPSYAAVLAAVSAHCGYVPRALHETAVALEDELSRERKR